jgi:polyketide synthase PksN/surfactin family lipopeptide synthetase A
MITKHKFVLEEDGHIQNEELFNINTVSKKDIAIIGVSGRLANMVNVEEFWGSVKNRIDLVTGFPESRRNDIGGYLRHLSGESGEEPKYIEAAYLEAIDKFDYGLFHLSPKEASLMDPNQRLLLEEIWHAIEDAGYGGNRLKGSNTGVYIGFAGNMKDSYQKIILELAPSSVSMSKVGNMVAMMPSRISYLLDLKGPTMIVDTACSSVLVAAHLACQAIKNGDCNLAVVGGVRINLLPVDNADMKFGIESLDYRTRTFDDHSEGSSTGEGVGAILLKPLSQAIKDRDNIYAVIKGSAVNQDGTTMGITVPNSEAQARVIMKAWEDAKISPETISYIQTHGTGTALGDPIEIDGLQKAFAKYTDKRQFCAVGSVKTNIGHLYDAAGIVNLLTAIMAIKHKELPPSIFFNKPNRKINFEDSPVYVSTKARKWETGSSPRTCGVSAFGFSGTNCHLVLQEAPILKEDTSNDQMLHVLTLSGRNQEVIRKLLEDYGSFVNNGIRSALRNISFTANTGRGHYSHRLAIIVENIEDLKVKIEKLNSNEVDFIRSKEPWLYYGEHRVIPDNTETSGYITISERQKAEISQKAGVITKEFVETGTNNQALLAEICRLYVKGADIGWTDLYPCKGKTIRKTSLPVYPFQQHRCWVETPSETARKGKDGKKLRFFSVAWRKEEVKRGPVNKEKVLLFTDSKGLGEELLSSLKKEGREVIEVRIGGRFKQVDDNRYEIQNRQEDYEKILKCFNESEEIQVIHLLTLDNREEINDSGDLEKNLQNGVISLLHLAKAIINRGTEQIFHILLVAVYASEVTGEEKRINPENASFFGLGKAINKECSHIKLRCVDIDETTGIMDLLAELADESPLYVTAYRNGQRYVEEFQSVKMEDLPDQEIALQEDGVYVITGGAGGIGLEIAKYFASRRRVRLALINRSKMPQREKWEEIISKADDKKLCKKINAIREIESLGAQIVCYSADVSDRQAIKEILDELREKYGAVKGIIHGAGVASNKMLAQADEETLRSVLAPKINGTWNLDRLTENDQLDFFIMFSSIATIFTSIRQGDYVAANSYLDSFAAYRRKKGKSALAIDWSTWKETGMSVEAGINVDTLYKALPTVEAIEGFDTVLNKDISRVLIGELNYDSKIIHLLKQSRFRLAAEIESIFNTERSKVTIKNRPIADKHVGAMQMTGRENNDYTEVEKEIAGICREMLEFSEINIYDSFFELGIDSIMLKKIHAGIEEKYPGLIEVTDFFEHSSIYKVSRHIAQKINKTQTDAGEERNSFEKEMYNILEEMEKGDLSIEQAISKIK